MHAKDLCERHYDRVRNHGSTDLRQRPAGTGCIAPKGYVVVMRSGVRKPEHVYVMEEILGRPLRPEERVHHRNGDRADNRPANLELWASTQPSGQRVVDLLAWAEEIVERYGDIAARL